MSYKHLPGLFAQALNEKRVELFDEFIHPEYKNHNPQVQPGPAGVKAFFEHYLNAFPDTQVVMEDAIEEGARFTYQGTFTNPFMGYRPNRAPVQMASIDIWASGMESSPNTGTNTTSWKYFSRLGRRL
jgi:hypothetical protein